MTDRDFIDLLSHFKAEIILPSIEAYERMQSLFEEILGDYIKDNLDTHAVELAYKGIRIYWHIGGVKNMMPKEAERSYTAYEYLK